MPSELHLQLESLLYSSTGITDFTVPHPSKVSSSATAAVKTSPSSVSTKKSTDTPTKDNAESSNKGHKKDSGDKNKEAHTVSVENNAKSGGKKKNNEKKNEGSSSSSPSTETPTDAGVTPPRGNSSFVASSSSSVNDQQVKDLRTELASSQQQLFASQQERETLVNEIQSLKHQLTTLTKQTTDHKEAEKKVTDRLEQDLKNARKNDEINQTTIKQLTNRVKEIEDLLEKQNKDTVITTLRTNIDKLNAENEKLRKTIGTKDKEISTKEKEISNFNNERTKYRREIQDTETKSRTEANEWLKQYHLLENERDTLKDKYMTEKNRAESVPSLQKTIEELKHTISNHKTVLDQANSNEQRYKALYEKSTKEYEVLQASFAKFKHDYSGTFQRYETLQQQYSKIENQRDKLLNEVGTLKEQIDRSSHGVSSYSSLEATNKTLQQSNDKYERELKELRQQNGTLHTTNRELVTQNNKYTKEYKTYQDEIASLRKQVIASDTKYVTYLSWLVFFILGACFSMLYAKTTKA